MNYAESMLVVLMASLTGGCADMFSASQPQKEIDQNGVVHTTPTPDYQMLQPGWYGSWGWKP